MLSNKGGSHTLLQISFFRTQSALHAPDLLDGARGAHLGSPRPTQGFSWLALSRRLSPALDARDEALQVTLLQGHGGS